MLVIESFANRPGTSLRKRKLFMSQSIVFYEVNLIIWMDAKSIYLTYRILIYGLKKVEFGENKILGEKVGILILQVSLKGIIFYQKRRGLLYHFYDN